MPYRFRSAHHPTQSSVPFNDILPAVKELVFHVGIGQTLPMPSQAKQSIQVHLGGRDNPAVPFKFPDPAGRLMLTIAGCADAGAESGLKLPGTWGIGAVHAVRGQDHGQAMALRNTDRSDVARRSAGAGPGAERFRSRAGRSLPPEPEWPYVSRRQLRGTGLELSAPDVPSHADPASQPNGRAASVSVL